MGRIGGEVRGARYDMNVYKQDQSRKTNNGPQKNENEHAQIDVTRWFAQQKMQARNKPKKTSRKATTRQNKSRQQNKVNKLCVKATKTKMRAQEVTQIEEVAPATTCIKARK